MIFEEQLSRKPDHYSWTQQFIDAMWNGHWTPNEFTFSSDVHDFKTALNDDERLIVVNTLSAIGQIEIAVKKFWARLGDHLPHPSISDLGLTMASVEVIHNQAYEKLLDVLNLQEVFESNMKLDIIKNRVNYLKKWNEKNYSDKRQQYVYSLILFTIFVENVSLFSQFYIIRWFHKRNAILKDTAQQVQYTAKEETLHALAGMKIIQTIRKEYPELFNVELFEKIKHESEQAFIAESAIIDWMVGDYIQEGLSAEVLKEYVKYRINSSLEQLDFQPVFEINSILLAQSQWMEVEVLGNSHTDFFHKRPVEYTKNHTSFSSDDLFDVASVPT